MSSLTNTKISRNTRSKLIATRYFTIIFNLNVAPKAENLLLPSMDGGIQCVIYS